MVAGVVSWFCAVYAKDRVLVTQEVDVVARIRVVTHADNEIPPPRIHLVAQIQWEALLDEDRCMADPLDAVVLGVCGHMQHIVEGHMSVL